MAYTNMLVAGVVTPLDRQPCLNFYTPQPHPHPTPTSTAPPPPPVPTPTPTPTLTPTMVCIVSTPKARQEVTNNTCHVTGVVTPLARRQQIYSICQKHDVIILEDDPYFYLQFSVGGVPPRGLQDLGQSYLSLDVDGRVIRLDSFSKVGALACCLVLDMLIES